jgi:hypothetical protein
MTTRTKNRKPSKASRPSTINSHKKRYRPPKDPIRNETIFNALQKELEGSYNIIITVSTAMFGGTLALDKFLAISNHAVNGLAEHRIWIVLAWICLLSAAFLAAIGRLCNGKSLEFLLKSDDSRLEIYDKHADHAQVWSIICFGIGLAFLVVFYSQV